MLRSQSQARPSMLSKLIKHAQKAPPCVSKGWTSQRIEMIWNECTLLTRITVPTSIFFFILDLHYPEFATAELSFDLNWAVRAIYLTDCEPTTKEKIDVRTGLQCQTISSHYIVLSLPLLLSHPQTSVFSVWAHTECWCMLLTDTRYKYKIRIIILCVCSSLKPNQTLSHTHTQIFIASYTPHPTSRYILIFNFELAANFSPHILYRKWIVLQNKKPEQKQNIHKAVTKLIYLSLNCTTLFPQ